MPPIANPSRSARNARETASRPMARHVPLLFSQADQRPRFERMMQQQFWLWGCDVRRPEGNLLTLHGFEKQRAPESAAGATSRYTRIVDGNLEMALWGFGLLARREGDGSVFLPRLSLRPRCGDCNAPLDGRWEPDDFNDLRRPTEPCDHRLVRVLLADVLRWIETYEQQVMDAVGLSFRAASVAAWKRPIGPAQDLPAHWNRLAATMQAEAMTFAAR
ncbi:MAG: hypothetical protein WBA46_08690 [Thermomicrobiales bacterium]